VDDLEVVDDVDREADVDDEVDSDAGVRPEIAGDPARRRETADREPAIQDGLNEVERQILAFERQWWKHAGSKEQAIRDLFGVSSTRYYQMLNRLLENPAALEYDPVQVKRLRRLRATRARARTGGRPL
jgi:Protein of unknown function (DUF3263).